MPRRLASLRGVPPEEAAGLRNALAAAGVDFYEIPPTAFGISAGSIWIRHESDFERARNVFDIFQETFTASARANHRTESLAAYIRRYPFRVAGYTAAAIGVVFVMFWPVIQLWG